MEDDNVADRVIPTDSTQLTSVDLDEKILESEETEVEDGISHTGSIENGNIEDENENTQEMCIDISTGDNGTRKANNKRAASENLQENDENSGSLLGDQEFSWDEFMEDTGSIAAPPTAFLHVENSLESGIKFKMVLEVPNREDDNCYWLATVVMTCGPLLSIRYVGYNDDRSNDFWWNITTSEVHAVGWCQQNNKKMYPPQGIRNMYSNWEFLLNHNYEPVPTYLLECHGSIPIDQIQPSMKVEVQDCNYPIHVWVATVIENVGGRLLLRYFGIESGNQDFWLFYLSHLIHPVGWAAKQNYELLPPQAIKIQKTEPEWKSLQELSQQLNSENKSISQDVLQQQEKLEEHCFEAGMKLEALHPVTKLHLYPATVKTVLNSFYFIVEIDDYKTDKPVTMCCHRSSQVIFPINWAKENCIKLKFPRGYIDNPGNKDFDWEEYLQFCKGKAAPGSCFIQDFENPGFELNTKLEVVNPFQPNQVCAGTILSISSPLLFIRADSIDVTNCHHVVPFITQDIFPVGWCESNNFPLKPPRTCYSKRQRTLLRRPSSSSQESKFKLNPSNNNNTTKESSKSWCSKIYFNHRCFSGPLLSKSRLAQLPQHIGPGPVSLVMREVLSSLINVAYISSRVLRELQLRGKAAPYMNQEVLKAKWKGKTYRAVVEVVSKGEYVEDFCKQICSKLECCPYLFGLKHIEGDCPEKCHLLTKTKYAQNGIIKKRKIGRPPLAASNIPRGPGRRRKRHKWKLQAKASEDSKKEKSNDPNEIKDLDKRSDTLEETSSSTSPSTDLNKIPIKRTYKPFTLPKSNMVTRGAKIPNFSLEMKWRRQRVRKLMSSERPCNFVQGKRKVGRPRLHFKHVVTSDNLSALNIKNSSFKPLSLKELLSVPEPIIRPIPILHFDKNPINWTVEEVSNFINQTECAPIASALKDEEVDGQSLLLMTLPVAQEFLQLKFGPAVRLCHIVEGIKLAFYMHYAKCKKP